jgi:hypothetical protein
MRYLGRFSALFLLAFSLQWLGAWSNQAVVAANDGKMPVLVISSTIAQSVAGDDEHSVLTIHSRYLVLCDLFAVPIFYGSHIGLEVVSIGDVGIEVGGFIFLLLPFLPFYWLYKGLWRKS